MNVYSDIWEIFDLFRKLISNFGTNIWFLKIYFYKYYDIGPNLLYVTIESYE